MHLGYRTLFKLLILLMLPCAAFCVEAASFNISPMTFVLTPERASAVMKISNDGNEAVRVQIQAMSWDIENNLEQLVETDQLVVNPPVVTIGPNQVQFVRLGARSIVPSAQERSFRLILEEVPMSGDAQRVGIRTILRISSPLFIPSIAPREEIDWSVVYAASGAQLVATNSGNTHQKFFRLQLLDKPDAAPAVDAGLTYLLPGQTRRWPIKNAAPGSSFKLRLQTEKGSNDQTLSTLVR